MMTAARIPVPIEPPAWLPGMPPTAHDKDDPDGWYQRALIADAVNPGANVLRLAATSLSLRERAETRAFTRHSLESLDPHTRPYALPADRYTWAAPTWSVMVKADQSVVTHAGILYRVIQAGDLRVPVGGITSVMTRPDWRGRGYARAALTKATAFVAVWLWAPFAVAICPRADTGFYELLGWQVAEAPICCDQPGGKVRLEDEVVVYLPCQGEATWPSGPIDLWGAPW
jgi:GNAT superfamily N-acetyltransferase